MPPRSYPAKKTGPDLSWADDNDIPDPNDRAISPPSNIPGPIFPARTHNHAIRTPKPLSASERRAVTAQLSFRRRCREGPLFTVLDRNGLLVSGVSRHSEESKRRGVDPFDGQERYSTRHAKKARIEPDLGVSGRGEYGYSLGMFPEELWGVVDPGKTCPEWSGVEEGSVAFSSLPGRVRRKRKRGDEKLDFERQDRERVVGAAEEDDEDPIQTRRHKKPTKTKASGKGERKGLDAEDDVDDGDGNADEEEGGEEEVEDSDFSEDSDQNDYDAEQYFDAGEDEDDAGEDHGGGDGDY